MSKIKIEFETEYDKGDVVVFKKDRQLKVGLIEGYYVEDNCIWYNIRISPEFVYTYSNGGDIPEWDIVTKLDNIDYLHKIIIGAEED